MNIKASIPIEKVWVSAGTYTYRQEQMDCEVVAVVRRRCGANGEARRRFYYEAFVKPPAPLPVDYPQNIERQGGLFRVNIVRSLNTKWKPPVFPEGVDFVKVAE